MDLTTLCVGIAIAVGTIVGFKYMLLMQDRYFDKMMGNGDGSLRV